MIFGTFKRQLPTPDEALPGRSQRPFPVPAAHAVLGTPLEGPYPDNLEVAVFAGGCFWSVEEAFWRIPGVWSTAAGYVGGATAHPTYEEVCSGRTGHTEAVQVVFDPSRVTYEELLRVFWEEHDPTQGFRQGNDVGTQYRSGIYWTTEAQREAARATRELYAPKLKENGYDDITTEIVPAGDFYFAEDYHQQYLAKNPNGYCGIGGTGVSCPIGVGVGA